METERKYENGNGNLQNESGNGIFYAETETKTEQMREPEDIPRRTVPQATAHTSKAKITTIQAVRTTVPQTATQPTVRA